MEFFEFLRDPVTYIAEWLSSILIGWGVAPEWVTFILFSIGAAILGTVALLLTLLLIWAERKIIGRMQDRFGPNRVGPWGIFQSVADMVKIFIKEHIIPDGVDPIPFHLAPIIVVSSVLLVWSVIPFSESLMGSNLNVAVLFILAVGGVGEIGIMMAGWGSNNKYALLSAFRASAQMISYEVPMAITLLIPVMLSGSMAMGDIVKAQTVPYFFIMPLAAIIFFVASIAENGRAPFDLAEAESELVAGFNTEYSGLKFGMFYVADFLRAFTSALIFASIFLGGWQGPGAEAFPILGGFYLVMKSLIVWFAGVWIRGTLPRFRIDQMMDINWKFLTPLSLVLLLISIFVQKLLVNTMPFIQMSVMLGINLLLMFIAYRTLSHEAGKLSVEEIGSRSRPLAKPDNVFIQSSNGG
jgi:NADH-quinone oxidoreductase subunit H